MQEWMFAWCHKINDLLNTKQEKKARDELIKLLARLEQENIQYSPIVNHLIRETGLYPYMKEEFADWEDKFVCEAFKINVGRSEEKILHREQSLLLKKLIDGKNIAVSAPTSFGKSFIIDAFISLKNPDNVVIIVPTIALADETRRRLYKKFANKFKIITTSDVDLAERNIFIFPQERAIGYCNKIANIDILIIDEFYKASIAYDKERAPVLLKAILELGKKAKQKYFLAPNISEIKNNPITEEMEKIQLDFNTVFSEIHKLYEKTQKITDDFKKMELLNIIKNNDSKSLIYAGTFSNIDKITNILKENIPDKSSSILNNFSDWLKINYLDTYILSDLVKKGIGIHNGKLHRSLSQIQVRLFEDENGLDKMISTSSIIEGVNTSAENVIIWANKNGGANLNNFTYKNIIGRGGRMFKHFIGKIYLLDCPPAQEPALLELKFSDEFIVSMNKDLLDLSDEQNEKVQAFKNEMNQILGSGVYEKAVEENIFQTFNPNKLKQIAIDMQQNISSWNGLAYLNSDNPDDWTNILYKVLKIMGKTSASYTAMVDYINSNRTEHILTIEDPIEYIHVSKKSIVHQRELGQDTRSTANALRSALREDPDVILVGEMRDLETISLALTAAETGHLVMGTLHTASASQTIDRIIDVFPQGQQQQIRLQLSNSLIAVFSQTLLPKLSADGVTKKGRVMAQEIMIVNSAISNLVREQKTAQIYSAIQTGSGIGMQTLEMALIDLYRQKLITKEDALAKSLYVEELKRMMGNVGVRSARMNLG